MPRFWAFRFHLVFAIVFFVSAGSASAIKPETRLLLDDTPGLKAMMRGEAVGALYGAVIASDSDPQTSTDDFVSSFVGQCCAAFGAEVAGAPPVQLSLVSNQVQPSGKFAFYKYAQIIEGLPVHDANVLIPVLLGPTEKIGYVAVELVEPPLTALPADQLSAAEAVAIVAEDSLYGALTTFGTPLKVVFQKAGGTLHRAWRFHGHNAMEARHQLRQYRRHGKRPL